jgi:transposase
MRAYLQTQHSWLTVERLPGYAPDLNPTELVWGNVKGRELANLCADNLGEVERAVRTGLRRVRRAPTLAFAFLRHAGLSF